MSLTGVVNHPRVRVLWNNGLLRAFDVAGSMVFELKTEKPRRIKGTLMSWAADNDIGPLTLKARCMTCGGPRWWKVLWTPSEELWRTPM
jgi:hypothetical protein